MPKEAVFTMKLEPELRDQFMAEAEASDRPASQIMRELMREFVKRQREAREYDDWFRQQVEAGRESVSQRRFKTSEEVEAHFAELRAQSLRKADEADL